MTINHLLFILIALIGFQGTSQTSYKKVYSITIEGQIIDEKSKPIPNAVIKAIYNAEPISISAPIVSETYSDSLGNYKLLLEKNGMYVLEFKAKNKITYTVKCFYTKDMALSIRKREYKYPLQIQLMPQTKKIKTDIYNGGELIARSAEVEFIPFTRYLQAHDYEYRAGFTTPKKAVKFITLKIEKSQLPELLSIVATRTEIDTVIKSDNYYPEIRKKWQQFFGLTDPNLDKRRIEMTQDFYKKISEKDDNNKRIYKLESSTLDLTKTVMADDSKKVFNLYRYNFSSSDGKTLSYDIMLFNSLNGWKINYISENY